MKKISVLIFALLMTILVLSSCDTDGPEDESSVPVESSSVELSSDETFSEPVSEVSSVEVPSTEISSKLENESSDLLFANIVTEEDKQYFKYRHLLASGVRFTDAQDLTYEDLMSLYNYMIGGLFDETYNPISDNLVWGETYSFSVSEIEKVLQTYLGDYPFAEKLRGGETVNTKYNAATDTIDVIGEYFSVGGYVAYTTAVPIVRENDCVIVYVLNFNESFSEVCGGTKIVILEENDKIQFKSFVPLTEEEIADLNEKYFGEA